ncbi:MAG: hypothetical protein ACD_3C00109G0007 [uncultured bacterium (gcode 4)]|uniref:Uncharacterized protein n=1 Tax=uncultured bacterium (gcode 4) TaxID=1234023 RepID=K2FYL1_9BACT|nr:MAG: hypothetical protein ACD_3C00109G0007 [uncultured bacterium (gcode 4)]
MNADNLNDIIWLLWKDFNTIAEELWHSPDGAREVVEWVIKDNRIRAWEILETETKLPLKTEEAAVIQATDEEASEMNWWELKVIIENKYKVYINSYLSGWKTANGKKYWIVHLSNWDILPFFGDVLFDNIWGHKITSANIGYDTGLDAIRWQLKIQWNLTLPFAFIIKKINWTPTIEPDMSQVRIATQPYKNWDELEKILEAKYGITIWWWNVTVHNTPYWVIYWHIIIKWNPNFIVPFIWDKIYFDFWENKILNVGNLSFDWLNLTWEVELEDWEFYEFIWNKLISKVVKAWEDKVYTSINILKEILNSKYGFKIKAWKDLDNLPNWWLTWKIRLDDGFWYEFTWDSVTGGNVSNAIRISKEWDELRTALSNKYSINIVDYDLWSSSGPGNFPIFWWIELDSMKIIPFIWDTAIFSLDWLEIIGVKDFKPFLTFIVCKIKVAYDWEWINAIIEKKNWIYIIRKK